MEALNTQSRAMRSKLNCEVLHEDLAFEVRWAVAGDSVVVQLVAKLENGEYMSFGPSGDGRKNQMIGADIVVAWVDHETLNGYAVDYFLDDKSQCSGNRGSCPDYRLDSEKSSSVRLLNAALVNGYSIVTYQRPLRAHDALDKPIFTNTSQAVVWGLGPLNQKQEVSFHSAWSKDNILLDFGRTPQWNCPIPEQDAALGASNQQPQEQDISPPELTTTHSERSPAPPAAAARQSDAWEIPPIQCDEPDDGVFYAQMGPTGGKRGYPSITKHVGWGIAYYINGLLIPEINVVRGKTYTFVVEGGLDPDTPAKYHPFYITDDPVGGYANKSPEEQKKVRVFAGVEQSRSGELVATGAGRLCNWTPDPEQPPADDFVSFGAYQRTLTLICDHGEPGVIQWTPDEDTPDTVYYQCFVHRYLGWKINVHDRCDTQVAAAGSAPSETRVKYEPDVDELESHPSIKVATRVMPEGPNFLPLVSNGELKHSELMAEYKKNFAQIPVNFKEHQKENHYTITTPGVAANHKYPASTMDLEHPSSTEKHRDIIPVSEDMSQDISTERSRPMLGHKHDNRTSSQGNYYQASPYNRQPYIQGQVINGRPMQRRPVISTMTIIRPHHRRPAPHHHMMMMSKPMMHRPMSVMAAPSNYRPVYVKKPIYRMPAVSMQRPVMMMPPEPQPSETMLVPPRVQTSPQQPQTMQTVSVSYSSSKGKGKPQQYPMQMKAEPTETKKYILPQIKANKHEVHSPVYKPSSGGSTGGFNPGTLVIEGGFKPIIQNTQEAQDRISEAVEEDDTEGTIDLSLDDEASHNGNDKTKPTEYFEPMFIPSPPDSIRKHAKKPTGLEFDLLQKKKSYVNHKPVRQNMIVIRRRPVSPSFRSTHDDSSDETAMAAERMDTFYLPPSGPIYGMTRNGQVAVPANTESGSPTLLTYDGKLVSLNNAVSPPDLSKRRSSVADLVRSTPQFGPFRGDVPPAVVPEYHAMALQLTPERTHLSVVKQPESEALLSEPSENKEFVYRVDTDTENKNKPESEVLMSEPSDKKEFMYRVDTETDNKNKDGIIIVLAEDAEKQTGDRLVEEEENEEHKRARRFAHHVPGHEDDHSHHDHHNHMNHTMTATNTCLRLATQPTFIFLSLISYIYLVC